MATEEQSSVLRVRTEKNVRWIRLDRPQVLNALSSELWSAIAQALDQAEDDDSVDVIVLSGAEGVFSAGYDVQEALGALIDEEGTPQAARVWSQAIAVGNDTCWRVWNSTKPVLAVIRGYCLGGAFELAMACDFVLCDASAIFGEPEIRMSDAPPFLISPWVMDMRRAKDLLLTGDLIDAETAMSWNLVTAVHSPEGLDEATRALARKLSGFSRETWALNKRAVNGTYEVMGLHAAIQMGADGFGIVNSMPTALKSGFIQRMRHHGLRESLRWLQERFE